MHKSPFYSLLTVCSLFTVMVVVHAGNAPSACDMARDKRATRQLMAAAGLPSPKYATISGGHNPPLVTDPVRGLCWGSTPVELSSKCLVQPMQEPMQPLAAF